MNGNEEKDLIEALVKIQNVHMWKDHQVASVLGITRGGWCAIRRGHANMGLKVLRKVLINFPELTDHVTWYVINGAKKNA